jgi:hypothetical protein
MWRSLRCPSHPHMPTRLPCLSPVLSALQTPRTSTFSFFFVEITHFDEFRTRGLLVHLGARCVCVCLSSCIHVRIGRLVLPPPPNHCFAHPSSRLSLIPVFREMCVFWKCVWKFPQDGECGSRVGKKTLQKYPPPMSKPSLPSP